MQFHKLSSVTRPPATVTAPSGTLGPRRPQIAAARVVVAQFSQSGEVCSRLFLSMGEVGKHQRVLAECVDALGVGIFENHVIRGESAADTALPSKVRATETDGFELAASHPAGYVRLSQKAER